MKRIKIINKKLMSGLLAVFFAGKSHILAQNLEPWQQSAANSGWAEVVPGELIIQFTPTVTDPQIAEAFRLGGLNMIKHVRTSAMQDHGQMGLTHVSTILAVPAAVAALNNLPGVDFAEPNWMAAPDAESNDPFYLDGSLWGMFGDDLAASGFASPIGAEGTTNPYGSQAEKAWSDEFIGSPGIYVGIIDTGLQFYHEDLADNVWNNSGEIPDNGLDEDGNGYVDDIHGWNSTDDNGSIDDPNGHGTHVAGTIGARGGNGIGVAGVNWNVTLISGKNNFTTLNAIEAVDYMTNLKTRKGLNLVALNNSWSGGSFSQALLDAYVRAAKAGILSVCSASNQNSDNDTTPRYPACFDTTENAGYDAIISVAAINKAGDKASFSNYGAKTVDLGAPGQDVISTAVTDVSNSYSYGSGTSMATPHVTGSVALYSSIYSGASAPDLKTTILTSGIRPLSSLEGITVTGGMLDIGSLIAANAAPLPTPAAPLDLQAVSVSDGPVDVSWSDQSDNELGFAIERSTDGQNFVVADTVGANFTSYLDRTVRPGATYYYRLRAYNPSGSSEYAYARSAVRTPEVTLPAAPFNLKASAVSRGGVKLTWTDNANNEKGFQVQRKTGSDGTWQYLVNLGVEVTSYTDTSTVSRTTYNYRVRAYNAAGPSAYSIEVAIKAK